MSISRIFSVLAIIVIVVDAQRPIGTFLTNVGDLFGYDVFRRPRIVLAIPATIPVGPAPPAAGPAPAPAPAAAPAGAAAPAPAPAPAAAPAAPALNAAGPATQLLTDSVRRQFSINLNWDRNRSPPSPEPVVLANLVGPPVALASAPSPAPAAAPAPVAPAPVLPNPAAAPVPVPQRTESPAVANVDYDDSGDRDSADYEDRPKRFHIELPDYNNVELTENKRPVDNRNEHDDSKDRFKQDFQQFWDSSPWTVEHGYKYILPEDPQKRNYEKEESKELSNYQVYKIPDDHNKVRDLKVTHNIKFYEKPAEELIYAPSTAVTYFEPPPANFQGQNVDYVVHHNGAVASPSYLTSRVVNAALLKYFDEKAKKEAPIQEQQAPSYLTSKVVNAELLKYFNKKFQNDAIIKQQEANANPVDNVPYHPAYVHPVTKSIPHLVNPQSSLEYYSSPYYSPPESIETTQHNDADSGKEAVTLKKNNEEKINQIETIVLVPTFDLGEITLEKIPIPKTDNPEKIILVDQDIRYNPDHRIDDSQEEQKSLKSAQEALKADLVDDHQDLKAKHGLAESSEENKDNLNDDKYPPIVEINDKENFEVENLQDVPQQEQQENEKENEEQPENENEEQQENEKENEEQNESENEEESEKVKDEENENEQEIEKEDEKETEEEREDESVTETKGESRVGEKSEENQSINPKGNESEEGTQIESETKKQPINNEDDINELDKFIEKHFSDFEIPDYESIREEVRRKDKNEFNNEESKDNEQEKESNEEELKENEDDREEAQSKDEQEEIQSQEEHEEEQSEGEQQEKEEKGESQLRNNYENDDDERESSEQRNADEIQKEKEARENEEKARIRELEELHEKEFYSIFPKLGEGSSFINFLPTETDNNGKDSTQETELQIKPTNDEFYKSFNYKSTQKPENAKTSSSKPGQKHLVSNNPKSANTDKEDTLKDFNINNQYETAKQNFFTNLHSESKSLKKYQPPKQNLIDKTVAKDNFQNKDNHEATERTIVQPLYSGVWNIAALQELYKSDKPVTVPFDHEYAASMDHENYPSTDTSIRVKRNAPHIQEYLDKRPEELKEYEQVHKYTEDFSYEVPEPKVSEHESEIREKETEASQNIEEYSDENDEQESDANSPAKYIAEDINKFSQLFNQKVNQIKEANNAFEYTPESTNQVHKTKYLKKGQKKAVPKEKKTPKKSQYIKIKDAESEPSQRKEFITSDIEKLSNYNRQLFNSFSRVRRSTSGIAKFLQEKPQVINDYERIYKYREGDLYEVPEPKQSKVIETKQSQSKTSSDEVKDPSDEHKEEASGSSSKYVQSDIDRLDDVFNQRGKQIEAGVDALEYLTLTNQAPKTKDYEENKYIKDTSKSRDSFKQGSDAENEYIGSDIRKLSDYLDEKPDVIHEFERNHEYNDKFTYEVPEPKIDPSQEKEETSVKEKTVKGINNDKSPVKYKGESSDKQLNIADGYSNAEQDHLSEGPSDVDQYEKETEYIAASYNQKFTYESPEPATPNYAELEKKDYKIDESFSPNVRVTGNSAGRKKIKITVDKPVHHVFN